MSSVKINHDRQRVSSICLVFGSKKLLDMLMRRKSVSVQKKPMKISYFKRELTKENLQLILYTNILSGSP